MAVIRLIDPTDQAVETGEGVEFGNPFRRQDFQWIAGEITEARDMAKLIHPIRVAGNPHGA